MMSWRHLRVESIADLDLAVEPCMIRMICPM